MNLKEKLERELQSEEDYLKVIKKRIAGLRSALEEEDREVPSRLWQCKYTECDHSMGLAGRDSCPGDPLDDQCVNFTTEYSEYKG